jgi:hypothetical protein
MVISRLEARRRREVARRGAWRTPVTRQASHQINRSQSARRGED